MKFNTFFIATIIILISILSITIFSYSELSYVFNSQDKIIESHATNLILLNDLEVNADHVGIEILSIHSDVIISSGDVERSHQRIENAKTNMYKIFESNSNLEKEFLNEFTLLANHIFIDIALLDESLHGDDIDTTIPLLSEVTDDVDLMHVLLKLEFEKEKEKFISLHEDAHEGYIYANQLLILVIATSIFFIFLISFWIYKTAKINEQDILKTEFTSMITHELKTPLTPIIAACDMLINGMMGKLNPSQKEEILIINRNAFSLLKIITDILDAQKLDMGKLTFVNSKFLVSDLFNELLSDNQKPASKKNVKLIVDLKKDISIVSDKNRIRQIFNNLILNSLDFVKMNTGIVKLGAFSKNDGVVFFIKDNGIGIENNKQSELFKKFYQVDTSLKRKHGGTGLGLAVCKGIVEGLGGEIWVESEIGTGTSVFFNIPVKSVF